MSADSPELIRFDRRTRALLVGLVFLLGLATGFKIHGSSLGLWGPMLGERVAASSRLLGAPRTVRRDEWGVLTLAIVSQARSRPAFPLANPSFGAERVPLIFNLPVRHWSMLVRPQFWGFFVLDLERGFAFSWNMKAFLLLSGVFLLLMLLTANDFWISLLGAAWVFLSGFMQWWYSTPALLPELVGSLAWLIVAAHYLLLSRHRSVIACAALVFTACIVNAALSLYPPFQVPLFYLGVAILLGSLGPRLVAKPPLGDRAFRTGSAVVAVAAIVGLLALFYRDAGPTIELMRATLYPGSRLSLGGDTSLTQIFGGFYGFLMSQSSHPAAWSNVCEASNFVLLFPVPLAVLVWRVVRGQPVTSLECSLSVYLIVVLAWLSVGGPQLFAVATGFGHSHGSRSLLGLGLGSILLCCSFLSSARVDLPARASDRLLIAAALLAALGLLAFDFARVAADSATLPQIALATLVAGASAYLLLARRRALFAAFVLVPAIWAHALVNPVAIGMAPILDAKLFRAVSQIVEREPDARWIVFGGSIVANLIKATGARVFGGTMVVPPFDAFEVLDPDRVAPSVYNRYAHIGLIVETGPEIAIQLRQRDDYTIAIDPKSDLWRQLDTRYTALPLASTDPEFLARTSLILVHPEVPLWIYRHN